MIRRFRVKRIDGRHCVVDSSNDQVLSLGYSTRIEAVTKCDSMNLKASLKLKIRDKGKKPGLTQLRKAIKEDFVSPPESDPEMVTFDEAIARLAEDTFTDPVPVSIPAEDPTELIVVTITTRSGKTYNVKMTRVEFNSFGVLPLSGVIEIPYSGVNPEGPYIKLNGDCIESISCMSPTTREKDDPTPAFSKLDRIKAAEQRLAVVSRRFALGLGVTNPGEAESVQDLENLLFGEL